MATKQQTRRPRPRRAHRLDGARVARTLSEIVPSTARAHLLQARREVLLALRDVLDHAISRVEAAGRAKRLRRIKVE